MSVWELRWRLDSPEMLGSGARLTTAHHPGTHTNISAERAGGSSSSSGSGASPRRGVHLHAGAHGGRRHRQHGEHHPVGARVARVKAQDAAVVVGDAAQDLQRLLGRDLLRRRRRRRQEVRGGSISGAAAIRCDSEGQRQARLPRTERLGPAPSSTHAPFLRPVPHRPAPTCLLSEPSAAPMPSSSSPLGLGNSAMIFSVPCSRR